MTVGEGVGDGRPASLSRVIVVRMKKVGADIQRLISEIGGNTDAARVNMRTQQVRERYKAAIESVYPDQTAKLHLAHTNNVIITSSKGVCTLIVYVDDSLFAAELNAQRELVKLRLLELFGEEIEDFQIKISRWKKFRENHPYIDEEQQGIGKEVPSIPLDENELSFVNRTAAVIEDEKVRESLEKAMKADLEWKKGEKVYRDGENAK